MSTPGPNTGTPIQPKLRDHLLSLLLLVATAGVLGYAQKDQGVTRDEGTYFQAAEQYWGWFERLPGAIAAGKVQSVLAPGVISQHWSNNNEHPVLCKSLFGVSWKLLRSPSKPAGSKPAPKPLLSEISSYRAPAWLFAGLAAAILYLFGLRIESRTAGLTAALLYLTIPRLFFHAQLACFDSPIATMWLLTVYAYFRSLEKARWAVLAGVCFGLALATKHNAWFIPALLVLHYLIGVWPDVSLRPLRLPRVPLVFICMAILGPLVFWAHWPWLWFDTIPHLKGYFAFHLHHSYYNIEYLGKNWGLPPHPMSYPFLMTLFTVPTVTLVLALAGLWAYLRVPLFTVLSRWLDVRAPRYESRFRYPAKRSFARPAVGLDPRLGILFALNALFPLILIALPSTPIFGGTKHWLPAYPFFALLGGVALSRLLAEAKTRLRLSAVARGALVLLVAVPGGVSIMLTHPFGLTQYNALAGGPAGGADLGLNRQFWGYASRQVLPWMNAKLPQNARVYFHDTSYDAYQAYLRDGLLRPDIAYAGMEKPAIEGSSEAMVIHELHFNKYDYWIWDAYGTATPARVLQVEGVPVLSFYQRPRALEPQVDGQGTR